MIESFILFGILILRILLDIFAICYIVARAYLGEAKGFKTLAVFWATSLFLDVILMNVYIFVSVILEL